MRWYGENNGGKFCQKLVDEFHNNDPDKNSLTQARLLQFAQENNENDDMTIGSLRG